MNAHKMFDEMTEKSYAKEEALNVWNFFMADAGNATGWRRRCNLETKGRGGTSFL